MSAQRNEEAKAIPQTVPHPWAALDSRWTIAGVCVFLALIVWIIYGQTLHYGFLHYDDNDYVYEDRAVTHGLTLKGVAAAISYSHSDNWVPATTMSHMLDCQLYGLNAGGHHLTNVLLHAATAILLFLVLRQMTGALWRSAFVAAVFAVHPLRVEAVAWVSARKDVLGGLFFMLTLLAYVRYVRSPKRLVWYPAMLFFFALGLMSTPMLVTLPFVLLLLDYWPLQRVTGDQASQGFAPAGKWQVASILRLLREKIPFFLLSFVSCIPTVLAERVGMVSTGDYPIHLRIENALVSYTAYIGQLFYPAKLAAFYPYPVHGLPLWETISASMLLAAISVGFFFWRRKHPCLLVGWLLYLGMLVPHIGLVQVGVQARADRHTYLPLIGLCMLLTWLAADLSARLRQRVLALAGVSMIILVALIVCARTQTSYWRNDETLWTHALACTTDNFIAHNNLGNALQQKGREAEAVVHYQKALEIKPDYFDAYYNLGWAFFQQERLDEAMVQWQKALKIQPHNAQVHNDLGFALFEKGQVDEAIVHYRRALQIKPHYAEAHYNLGNALMRKGRLDEAIAQFQQALQLNPRNVRARNNLINALLQKGAVDEAIAQFQQVLQINPGDATTHCNLGIALMSKGSVDEAIAQFQQALQINPDDATAHYNLGNALLQKGAVDEAIAHYQTALRTRPRDADVENNLGNALLKKGRLEEAIAHFRQALHIKPDSAQALNNLAWILATCPQASLRNGNQAVQMAQQANELTGGQIPVFLGTLAAAYAEAGRFGDAVATAQKAIALAQAQGQRGLVEANTQLLRLYQAHMAYHEQQPSD